MTNIVQFENVVNKKSENNLKCRKMIKYSKINTLEINYYFIKCKKLPKCNTSNKIRIKKHNTKKHYVSERIF